MSNKQEYFSKNFVKDIIQKHVKNNVDILNIEKEYLLPPGENYVSELLRIVVKFSKNFSNDVQTIPLIMKIPTQNDHETKDDEVKNFFGCEMAVYSDVLPMTKKLEHTKRIAPNSYYLSKYPNKILVLEDLSVLNYKMCNRQEGLDLAHCLLSIEKLAYFHAASLAIYEENPKIMDIYNREALSETQSFVKWNLISFEETLEACRREPNLQKYAEKITQELNEKCSTSRNIDPKFNVLNHGDFWCNNLMFKYNEDGSVNDVMFVDFQMATFTSPFFDLHFFIATTPNLETKKTHINTILNCYYEHLCNNANLLKLNTKIPTREEFNKEFCDKAYIGLRTTINFMHIVKAGKWTDASLINFMEVGGKGSFRHHCFNNSDYLATLESSLSYYDSLEIVQNEFEEEIEIIDIDVSHLLPPGENYNSELFRIIINYSEKNRNNNKTMPMIVKRFIQNGFLTKCEEEMGFFTCELSMYNEILPIMNELGMSVQ